MSAAQRLFRGIGANVYQQVVTVVVQLIGVPVLLHAWGPHLYGEWLILSAIPSYLTMTDLGFSQSAANDMTQHVARGDRSEALAVFQSLSALVLCTTSVALLLVSALLYWLPLKESFHLTSIDAVMAGWIIWLLAAEVLVRLSEGVNHAGYRACGDYAFHVTANSTVQFIQYAAVWAAAISGGGPLVAAGALFLVRGAATPMMAMLLTRRHPWLRFGFEHARRAELRRLIKPALANISFPLAQALNIQGMVLVIGAALGPLAVVVFSTLRTMTRLALQLVLTISHAAEPELALAYGAGDSSLMQAIFIHALRAGLWLAIAAAASLTIMGPAIIDVWTSGKVRIDPELFHWLLLSGVATALWYTPFVVLKAANLHIRGAIVFCLSATVAIGAAWFLLSQAGHLADAGLALLLMDGVMIAYCLPNASNISGVNTKAAVLRFINPLPLLKYVVTSITKKRSAHVG